MDQLYKFVKKNLFSYACKNSHNTVITSLACTMTTMWTLHEFYISDFLVFR